MYPRLSARHLLVLILIPLLGAPLAIPAALAQGGPYAVALEPVADGFTHPLALAEAPDDSGRLFILDQTGQIWIVTPDGARLEEPFLDIQDRMIELNEGYDERGLLGMAFHPEYAQNGRLFVFYSAPLREEALDNFDHTNHLSEFTVSQSDPDVADPASERVLMRMDHPYMNHNAGQLAFGPDDGYLYLALGDGGHRDDQDLNFVQGHTEDWYDQNDGGNGQDIENNLLGSILRIDVDAETHGHHGGGMPYTIPDDNPFVDIPGVLPEQYAYGFRNPWRFSFDPEGEYGLIVGDVGQNLYGEISVVEKGGNYGWNVYEGAHCFSASSPLEPLDDCPDATGDGHPVEGAPLMMPVIETKNAAPFEDGAGLAIVGGYVYRGDALPDAFEGTYLFGQWSRGEEHHDGGEHHLPGRIYVATPEPTGMWGFEEVRIANRPDGDPDLLLLAFGQTRDGEVYALMADHPGPTGTTGHVFRIVPADMSPMGESR